jgi:hypothetical protein
LRSLKLCKTVQVKNRYTDFGGIKNGWFYSAILLHVIFDEFFLEELFVTAFVGRATQEARGKVSR